MVGLASPLAKPLARSLALPLTDPEGVGDDLRSLFAAGEAGYLFESFNPATAGLFQASDGTASVASDGDPVGYATDVSGRGNNGTMSTTGRRPLYRANGGAPYLEFDGTDDNLLTAFAANGAVTMAAAVRFSAANDIVMGGGTSAGSKRCFLGARATIGFAAAGYGAQSNSSVFDQSAAPSNMVDTDHVLLMTADAVTVDVYLDGVLVYTAPSSGAPDGSVAMTLGANNNAGTPGNFFAGRIYGALALGRRVTVAEVARITSRLAMSYAWASPTITEDTASTHATAVAASTGSALDTAKFRALAISTNVRSGATSYIEFKGPFSGTSPTGNRTAHRALTVFTTDAPSFEIKRFGLSNSGYTLEIDGHRVHDFAAVANDGQAHYDRVTFGGARRSRTVALYTDRSFCLGGVQTESGDTVTAAPAKSILLVFGDSYTGGVEYGYDDFGCTLARHLNMHPIRSGVGSTGYVSDNGGLSMPITERLADDIAAVTIPAIIMIAAGINDIPGVGSNPDQATLTTAFGATVDEAIAQRGSAKIVIVGPWRGSSGNAGSYTPQSMDEAFYTEVQLHTGFGTTLFYERTISDPDGAWQFGNLTDPNFSTYGHPDGTHYLAPGHRYLGELCMQNLPTAAYP